MPRRNVHYLERHSENRTAFEEIDSMSQPPPSSTVSVNSHTLLAPWWRWDLGGETRASPFIEWLTRYDVF